MPGALLPDDAGRRPRPTGTRRPSSAIFRLSSKSHWDVPIRIGGETVHFLVSHPTPPVFDGAGGPQRDAQQRRDPPLGGLHHAGGATAAYIYDDEGTFGGLAAGALFVIAGDQNSDPLDGDSIAGSIQQLLDHPLVNTNVTPRAPAGRTGATSRTRSTTRTGAIRRFDTADFCDTPAFPPCSGPGNLRADYVLPRRAGHRGCRDLLARPPIDPLVS